MIKSKQWNIKFSLRKKVGLFLFFPILTGLFFLTYFLFEHYASMSDISFTNIAGRQRFLASELHVWVDMVASGQTEDRKGLQLRIEEFNNSLHTLHHGGNIGDIHIRPPSPKVLKKLEAVENLWSILLPDLKTIVTAPEESTQFKAIMQGFEPKIEQLIKASDQVVRGFEKISKQRKSSTLYALLLAITLACMACLLGLWMAEKFIIQPILGLTTAVERIRLGDFSPLDLPLHHDEVGILIGGFNAMATRIEALFLEVRTHLQQSLAKEAELRETLHNIADGVCVINETGIVQSMNPALSKMTGYDPAFLVGKNIKLIMPPEIAALHDGYLRRYIETGKATLVGKGAREVQGCRRDGTSFPLSLTVGKFNCAGKQYLVGVLRDITEQKQTEQNLVKASKLYALAEMAAGIAHEINNPLSVVMTGTLILDKLVRQEQPDRPKILSTLERMTRTADRISKIVSGLRTFSRNSEQDPLVETSLQSIFDDVLALCAEKFKMREVELRTPAFPSIVIPCRATQICQVLLNLLHNALDAVEKLEQKWIALEFEQRDSNFYIKVTDSGNGIPEASLAKLMTPFFTTKAVGQGTGLGLSISQKIMSSHNGELTYNRESSNTQFVMRLPLTVQA